MKPPHTPERKKTHPQPWVTTTLAYHARAKGHHRLDGTTPPPPLPTGAPKKPDAAPAAQLGAICPHRPPLASWPPAPKEHHRGGQTLGNPTPKKRPSHPLPPLTHDPSKLAGATAQPAELKPYRTDRAASPCLYISHKAHGVGSRPAASRNTNSEPVSHAAHQPVPAPAQGGQREEHATPPQNKGQGRGETPPS